MAPLKNNDQLIDTPMNKLGLGERFNEYFKKEKMSQDEVLTLGEFMSKHAVIPNNWLITYRDRRNNWNLQHLDKKTTSWIKLRDFLLEKGFTANDWIQLLPLVKTNRGMGPDFTKLSKEALLMVSIRAATDLKQSSSYLLRMICSHFEKRDKKEYEELTIATMLTLCEDDFLGLLKRYNKSQEKVLRKTLYNVQKKFKEYGLAAEDGAFMKIRLLPLVSKDDFIEELVINKGFSWEDANLAVNLAERAGFISF